MYEEILFVKLPAGKHIIFNKNELWEYLFVYSMTKTSISFYFIISG